MNLPTPEELLANAILYLIHGGEKDTALLLLSCEAEFNDVGEWNYVELGLFGPREAYDELKFTSEESLKESNSYDASWLPHELRRELRQRNEKHVMVVDAFRAVTPPGLKFYGFEIRVKYADIPPEWRQELRELAHGRHIHNQGVEIPGIKTVPWNGLNFRSHAEVRIAEALEKAGVLFMPNCRGRVGLPQNRGPLEPDFLVCHEGRWGILEVDGKDFHPPERKAQEDERARQFKRHGLLLVESYDAHRCYTKPDEVVKDFLGILKRS